MVMIGQWGRVDECWSLCGGWMNADVDEDGPVTQ